MEPLSVISLFFNLATYNSKNDLKQYDQSHYYYSVADAKQQIFNGKVNNLNLKIKNLITASNDFFLNE